MNAVLIAVLVMLILSLLRINVVVSLIIGAIIGGAIGGLGWERTLEVYSAGLGSNAEVALSYGLLGALAYLIAKTGLPNILVQYALKLVAKEGEKRQKSLTKVFILFIIILISCMSQNVVPVHIAFIPILIPPLIKIFMEFKLDRRLIACCVTFGLVLPYMWFPVGFGAIFHNIIKTNMLESGLDIGSSSIPSALTIPAIGLIVGLILSFLSYRKERSYRNDVDANNYLEASSETTVSDENKSMDILSIIIAVIAIIVALNMQLWTGSMIIGALSGIVILLLRGKSNLKEADTHITSGMRTMAYIGFVMISAAGFAAVLRETGHVESLVAQTVGIIGGNQLVGALLMLVIGLLITIGIGSSFSTIPIIATIFVPLSMELGFSVEATIALIGTAAALGDAGSPASDSTLGPTAGLNIDGQHDHIWDTCVPTFVHYNLPLIFFGVVSALIL